MAKKKILLSGSYGTGNTGDEVILEVILNHLKDYDVTVLSHHPDYTLEKFPQAKAIETPPSFMPIRMLKDLIKLRFGNFRKRMEFVNAVKEHDLFLLGGGGLLVEIATSVLAHYIYQLKIAQFLQKPTKTICVGVGLLRTDWGKNALKDVLNSSTVLSVRDEFSKKSLEDIFVSQKINLIPDPAFAYEFNNIERKKKLVGINCYQFPKNEKFWKDSDNKNRLQKAMILKTIETLKARDYDVIMIPLGTDIDRNYCQDIKDSSPHEVEIFTNDRDYRAIADQLATCHFTITMRFHAGLLSFVSGIPSICVDNQFKSERLLREMDMCDLLYSIPDGVNKEIIKEIEEDDLISYIDHVETNYDQINEKIKTFCDEKSKTFKDFVSGQIHF